MGDMRSPEVWLEPSGDRTGETDIANIRAIREAHPDGVTIKLRAGKYWMPPRGNWLPSGVSLLGAPEGGWPPEILEEDAGGCE